jgi:hypothetical protein
MQRSCLNCTTESAGSSEILFQRPAKFMRAEDIAPAFEALKGRAEALYVVGDALVITHRIRINTLALSARLPTITSFGNSSKPEV